MGIYENGNIREPLSLENTLWTNTVITSGKSIGLVIFTGKHTRCAMNSRKPRYKNGIFDEEVNFIAKLIFLIMVIMAGILILFHGL